MSEKTRLGEKRKNSRQQRNLSCDLPAIPSLKERLTGSAQKRRFRQCKNTSAGHPAQYSEMMILQKAIRREPKKQNAHLFLHKHASSHLFVQKKANMLACF